MARGTHNSKLTIAVAAIAVTVALIWLSRDGDESPPIFSAPDEAAAATPPAAPSPLPARSPSSPPEPAAIEALRAAPEHPAAEAADDHGGLFHARSQEVERELARLLYRRGGRSMIDVLIGNGMAPSDSESIVRRAMDDIAACVVDALRAEAQTGPVPLDTLLFALEAVMAETDTPEAVEMLRTETIAANAEACTYTVGQQAGLPIG